MRMGSSEWLKTIIKKTSPKRSKKVKSSADHQSNGINAGNQSQKEPNKSLEALSESSGVSIEDVAAIRIQTAFRRFKQKKFSEPGKSIVSSWFARKQYKARKALSRMKGARRLQVFVDRDSVKKQASATSAQVQMWSKIQTQIRTRRATMVIEGRLKQKRQENQQKLEAKLHDIEVEWCGGSETKEEIIARIQQREEAAVKRERALAYAFSHQWRANSGSNQGPYEFEKTNWGWSWVDQWIAARPWETRLPAQAVSSGKSQVKLPNKVGKTLIPSAKRTFSTVKPANTDGKGSAKPQVKPVNDEAAHREPRIEKTEQEQQPSLPQTSEGVTA